MTSNVESFLGTRSCLRVRLSFLLPILAGLLLPAAARAQVTYTGAAAAQNFGSQAVGSPSGATTLSFTVGANTTVGSIGVVTQGAPNLDFANAAGSTCTEKTYVSATTCTVDVTFKPAFAGLRMGAVVFFSGYKNTGTVLGQVPVYGVGTGPQIGYFPSPATAKTPSVDGVALNYPWGIAVDGAGDIFIGDSYNSRVVEIPSGGGAPIAITPTANGITMSNPYGVAVDGAGNLFITDPIYQRVIEVPVGGGEATAISPVVNGRGLTYPYGVAVDGAGDLFIDDCNNNRVVEVPAGGGAPIAISPIANGEAMGITVGVAVDAAGDVFIGDYGNNRVVEQPAGGGAPIVLNTTANGEGLEYPAAIVVDGAGDVFVADAGHNRVVEVPAGGGAPTAIAPTVNGEALAYPQGVTLDAAGDLVIADLGNGRVVEVQRSQPPTLNFAATVVGSTSTDSPQTVTLENIGNAALTLTALSYPADFPEASGNASACNGTISLSAGQECDLPIDFTPKTVGSPLSEDVTITDNALNVAGAQQSIAASGTASPPITRLKPTSTSLALSTSTTIDQLPVTLTATVTGGPRLTGLVQFYDGSPVIGSAWVNTSGNARITTSKLAVGTHSLTAVYVGNSIYNTSTSSPQNLTIASLQTETTLTATSLNPLAGQTVKLAVTVEDIDGAHTPTGTVALYDESGLVQTLDLLWATATYSTSSLSIGSHTFYAVYSGDSMAVTSTSPLRVITVYKGITATPYCWPGAGSYVGSTHIAIGDRTTGALIFYTTDGSVPTSTSTPYTGPVLINGTTTIRAIAIGSGLAPSMIYTGTFTIH